MGSPSSEAGRYDNEGPLRQVTVGRFALGQYEVTNAEFGRFAQASGLEWTAAAGSNPAVSVSWTGGKG